MSDEFDLLRAEWEREDRKRRMLLADAADLATAWVLTGYRPIELILLEEVRACWGSEASLVFRREEPRGISAIHPDGRRVDWGDPGR